MITLALDASTYAGDVAVLDDGRVLAEESIAMRDAEHERLMPAVASALSRAGVDLRRGDIDRVVCGAGPGSFTSLRIAGAIAKGIAGGIGRPLYAASSMGLIAGAANLAAGTYLVAIDALRDEFYVSLYDVIAGAGADAAGAIVERERARLVPAQEVDTIASDFGARVVSPSPLPRAIHASPRARAVVVLDRSPGGLTLVDLATWEPSYGRLAEAQVRWERAHGKPLAAG